MTTSLIVYFGNLFFKLVDDGEHDPGDPNADKHIKKYLLSSKGSFSPTNGKIFFIEAKLPKEP